MASGLCSGCGGNLIILGRTRDARGANAANSWTATLVDKKLDGARTCDTAIVRQYPVNVYIRAVRDRIEFGSSG